jgi:hypothetical protein
MTHLRQQIRAAAVSALTGLASTGARVYAGRSRPLAKNHEPTLLVYTQQELSARSFNGNPPVLERVMSLVIEGRVSTAGEPDDALDQIAKDIEAAMWTHRRFGGIAIDTRLADTIIATEAEGERQSGSIRLTYEVRYQSLEGSADLNG